MSNDPERKLTKQECERAAQLLAGMVERARKKAVEAASSTQIQTPVEVSSTGEEGAGRFEGLQRPAPVIAASSGEAMGSGSEVTNGCGSPVFRGKFPVGYTNDNGLPARDDVVPADRAVTRSRVD
jgi:hypothetical protein